MAISSNDNWGRRITITLALSVFLTSLTTVCLLSLLPSSLDSLIFPLKLYFVFISNVSILGFVGAIRSNPTHLTIFSYTTLLDSLVQTPPRLLLAYFAPSISSTLCYSEVGHMSKRGTSEHEVCVHVSRGLIVGVGIVCVLGSLGQGLGALRVRRWVRVVDKEEIGRNEKREGEGEMSGRIGVVGKR